MGSLSGVNTPVVAKQPYSFRHQGIRIRSTDSRDDSASVLVAREEDLHRAIGSGSLVTKDGVTYLEDIVYGVYDAGRTAKARIASDTGNARLRRVNDGNVGARDTTVVIPTGLNPSGVQQAYRHTGNKVVTGYSENDTVIVRASDSGAFSVG